MGEVSFTTHSLAANTTIELAVGNNRRFVIVISGANTKSMYIANTNQNGLVSVTPVLTASGITINTSTANNIIITNANAGYTSVLLVNFTA